MLSRIYESEGGPESLDVLMKYLSAFLKPLSFHGLSLLTVSSSLYTVSIGFCNPGYIADWHILFHLIRRYKGMSHNSQPTSTSIRSLSPQSTGFSQIHSRGGGEGGGQAMSVLLSWHEKLVEIAGKGSIVRVMTDRRTVWTINKRYQYWKWQACAKWEWIMRSRVQKTRKLCPLSIGVRECVRFLKFVLIESVCREHTQGLRKHSTWAELNGATTVTFCDLDTVITSILDKNDSTSGKPI